MLRVKDVTVLYRLHRLHIMLRVKDVAAYYTDFTLCSELKMWLYYTDYTDFTLCSELKMWLYYTDYTDFTLCAELKMWPYITQTAHFAQRWRHCVSFALTPDGGQAARTLTQESAHWHKRLLTVKETEYWLQIFCYTEWDPTELA